MRKDYKVPYHIKKYIENELYHYIDNKQLIEEMRQDIVDESPTQDGQPRGNQTSDPTSRKVTKLISTRTLLIAEKKVNQIDRAYNRLVKEEQEVVDIIFNKGHSQIYAQTHDNISKDSYYNVRNKMIFYTAIEYGEI